MFITRKEFDEKVKERGRQNEGYIARFIEIEDRLKSIDLLAKELGYEYVSEAVKSPSDEDIKEAFRRDYWPVALAEQVAVLKWSWKKIKK